MAKYKVSYACGHGEHVEQLVGPEKDRERKIAWMEQNIVCPDCYRKQRAKEPITAEVVINICGSSGAWMVLATGDTYAIKDALKADGFRWLTYQTDMLGLRTRKGWALPLGAVSELTHDKIMSAWEKAKKHGAQNLIVNEPDLKIALAVAQEKQFELPRKP